MKTSLNAAVLFAVFVSNELVFVGCKHHMQYGVHIAALDD
jgi:hypothetical protein